MHKKLIAVLSGFVCLIAGCARADTYSSEVIMSPFKDQGIVKVNVRVSRLSHRDGKLVEELIEAPKITTSPGVPATLHSGPNPGDSDFASKEAVTVEVSWPYPSEAGVASCNVTVQRGKEIVSKSRVQLNVEGSPRSPLVVSARDIDPASVRIVEDRSQVFLLLEFAGKNREEVKKLAIENYGNKVRILDAKGGLTDGGLSFGTYHEIGMTLQYPGKTEAEQAAGLLRGEVSR